jgi:hypothetical protein
MVVVIASPLVCLIKTIVIGITIAVLIRMPAMILKMMHVVFL